MANKLDRRRIDRSEALLEAAFWEFDERRKSKRNGERSAFKHAIRGKFPQWFDAPLPEGDTDD